MKKTLLIAAYIAFFWAALPFGLFYSASVLDGSPFQMMLPPTPHRIVGICIAAVSAFLLALSIVQFTRFSRKLPISADPPEIILQNGLFAVWRHPIYLFYTLLFIGIASIIDSRSLLYIVTPVFVMIVGVYIAIEERILTKRFGLKYTGYRKRSSLVLPKLTFIARYPFVFLFKILFGYRVIGKKNIPENTQLFVVSAHRNYLDPFLISVALPFPVRFITTSEMFRKGLSAWLFKKFLCIPKRRYMPDFQSMKELRQSILQGDSIGSFPESERSWTGRLIPMKPEAIDFYLKYANIPLLPIRVHASYNGWPRWAKNRRKTQITVEILPPIRLAPSMGLAEAEILIATAIDHDDSRLTASAKSLAAGIDKLLYRCPECRTFDALVADELCGFSCRICKTQFTLNPNYDVQWKQELIPIHNVYNNIRITTSDIAAQKGIPDRGFSAGEWGIAYSPNCRTRVQTKDRFGKEETGELILTNRRLIWSDTTRTDSIELKEIFAATIESNYKLQIYRMEMKTLTQFTFASESALKWQDLIVVALLKLYEKLPVTR